MRCSIVSFCAWIFLLNCLPYSNTWVPQKLFLSVYYESQCPDSRTFIQEQLLPTVYLLQNYLTVRLIPFGKARGINNGYSGFECQHGPTECLGNLVHNCALDMMKDEPDIAKVNYVDCEMQLEAGANGKYDCVQRANLNTQSLYQCVISQQGISLQLESEYLTNLIRPDFIPTVTINNMFNQQIQDSAQVDLRGTVCSILKQVPPCAQYYNNMAMTDLFTRNKW